jgi:hypothetical protein
MYALKIEVDAKESFPSARTERTLSQVEDSEAIPVSVGNPRVEHLNGIVHLYRDFHGGSEPGSSAPMLPVWLASAPFNLPFTVPTVSVLP